MKPLTTILEKDIESQDGDISPIASGNNSPITPGRPTLTEENLKQRPRVDRSLIVSSFVHEDDLQSLSSVDSDEEKKENEEEEKEEAQIRPTATTTNQNDATANAPRIGILQRAYNFVSAAISAIVGCFSSARTNNDPSSVSF